MFHTIWSGIEVMPAVNGPQDCETCYGNVPPGGPSPLARALDRQAYVANKC